MEKQISKKGQPYALGMAILAHLLGDLDLLRVLFHATSYLTSTFLRTPGRDLGPCAPIHRSSFSHIYISKEHDYRNDETKAELVFEATKSHFAGGPISITEIQYWGNFIIVVLEDRAVDISELPRSITRCKCFYLYEDEMARPLRQSALRLTEPAPGTFDDGEYKTLRPGIMVSSGRHRMEGREVLTSSGVLVQDRNGYQYLTVASHGFPMGDKIFHPNSEGRQIGQLIMELKSTDVALVKLNGDFPFINEPFQNTVVPGPPVKLRRFASRGETRPGSNVYMNNPYTSYIEGVSGIQAVLRVPGDDPHEPEQEWIRTRWDYTGQGSSDQLTNGICGSPLWDDEGNVLGFFRYAPRSGHFLDWCMSIASTELATRGYSIVTQ
ncbi:uncharacterized protein GIQ15_00967 [Arthroderma uncinatum]|uniref:uncharacterized protein n=1 Tax=Arthroderma uncinatum TaxID=74035 RepID=UPI00144AC62C|nr:uncharacterized protein GIQ15_00967 [Arthroderma uncinatum]KAF3491450.1 hypothetical protein GIQ15_00967 [Arthroderma uncinatum]